MKKLSNLSFVLLNLFLFSITLSSNAFNYNISFTASGASTTIDYITVQNLTQGTTLTVPAGSALEVTAIKQIVANDESIHIYPNPIQDNATLSYNSNSGGNAQINVFGVDGRNLVGIAKNMTIGINQFKITLPKGAYTIQIIENGILHVAKVLSQSNNVARIEFSSNVKTVSDGIQKAKTTIVPMQYNYGDFLLFKAYAGNFVSVLTDIITGNKTINFRFVDCKDIDGNYYSIVTVGSQIWMAENLKTSKYRNNTTIPNKSNDASWGTITTDAYSDYSSPSNSTTYGKLYNWYSVSNSNNIAPLGWHVPTDADWTLLTDFLGGNGLAGSKLKENGNSHWATSNTDATNVTGFSALPGGAKSTDGSLYDITNIGYWWSSTESSNTSSGWYRFMTNLSGSVSRGYYTKNAGMSVRCVLGDLSILTTMGVGSITASSAISGVIVSFDGNLPTTSGICWSTSPNPTINDNKTTDGNGIGSFVSTINGLTIETTYYVRAYATNSFGTAYGVQQSFSTKVPLISTSTVSISNTSTATCGGSASLATGSPTVTARGICWSTNQNPTIDDNKTSDGTGVGSFISSITGLTAETVYYVRAYATNSVGTAYGTQLSFSTKLPVLTTVNVSAITSTGATSGGNITDIGGSSIISKGVCWSTTPSPTIALITKTNDGTGSGIFGSSITGLTSGKTYYVRAYATNSGGTAYGNEISFTTNLPTVTTTEISAISSMSATGGGNVTSVGGAAVTAKGLCWSTTTGPTITNNKTIDGIGLGAYTSSITGLVAETIYYVRSYATNSIGTSYGNEISFSTKLATVSTASISAITGTTAAIGGNVTSIGGADLISRGVCWSTNQNPTITDSKTTDGIGLGTFSSSITGLTIGTTYYVRAYATNSIGTAYGSQVILSTALPTVITTPISSLNSSSATGGGTVSIATGGASVLSRGVCWSTNPIPTISDNITSDGLDVGTYSSTISNILIGTTYYIRAYATNSVGTAYGNIISFSSSTPTVSTVSVSQILTSMANSGGMITSSGSSSVIARGVCWSLNSNPSLSDNKTVDGIGIGSFTSSIIGLLPETTYYVRAYATNSVGTAYGEVILFSTKLATIITSDISSISASSASVTSNVTDIGGAPVTFRGVCWSTTTGPTINNSKTINGTGIGAFSSSITGLTTGTTYYVRAYATNSIGTAYSTEISFSTFLPTVSSSAISDITSSSAACGGNVTAIGGAPVTARGVCWSTNQNPTVADNKTADGTGNGSFISSITGLSAETTYYVRAYSTNSIGTAYSTQITLSTALPTITTATISGINATSATGGATVSIATGAAPVLTKGICWSTNQNPTITDNVISDIAGIGSFSSSITGLTAETTYYVRAYATNSVGIAYGPQVVFSTALPTVSTSSVTSITTNGATCGGTVSLATSASPVTAFGVCWSLSQNPTIADNHTTDGTGTGTFSSSITGLILNTTYYIRTYATNSVGTVYGNQNSFITLTTNPGYTNGTLTVTATVASTTYIYSVWITNSTGVYIRTLTHYGTNYSSDLVNWYAVSSGATTNATTGATKGSTATIISTWNGKDINNAAVLADLDYKVWIEMTTESFSRNSKLVTGTFTKGPNAQTVTPTNVTPIGAISLKWVPVP